MTDALASEWLKLRTARSSRWLLAVALLFVLLMAAFTLYVVGLWEGLPPAHRSRLRAAPPEQIVLMPLEICAAVLGVLAITSEYATGMVRTSLTAVPRRGVLLAAKAAVVAGVTLAAGQAGVLLTFLTGRLIAGDRPIQGFTAPPAEELPAMLATGLAPAVLGLVGLGLGVVLRSTAGTVTLVVALLYVVPRFAILLPDPWNARVGSVLPEDLTRRLWGEVPMAVGLGRAGAGTGLSFAGALAVMALYVVVALGAAAVALRGRDAR
ncbi:ABC transporter permease [Streptosporangium sp. NPDC051022]|uniref:ABC transporter permease n=1 Tax=Streptosporangium sp. NPDC051022 TaxID=3155752 RepID=UPI0034362A57